jgi:hypothetical protein
MDILHHAFYFIYSVVYLLFFLTIIKLRKLIYLYYYFIYSKKIIKIKIINYKYKYKILPSIHLSIYHFDDLTVYFITVLTESSSASFYSISIFLLGLADLYFFIIE